MTPIPEPMLRAIVDHIADRWWLRDDKREEFRAALLAELTSTPRNALHLVMSAQKVSRLLINATRAAGLQRVWFGFPTPFNPDGIFRPREELRASGGKVKVRQRSGGSKPVRWLELYPFRDPELRCPQSSQ